MLGNGRGVIAEKRGVFLLPNPGRRKRWEVDVRLVPGVGQKGLHLQQELDPPAAPKLAEAKVASALGAGASAVYAFHLPESLGRFQVQMRRRTTKTPQDSRRRGPLVFRRRGAVERPPGPRGHQRWRGQGNKRKSTKVTATITFVHPPSDRRPARFATKPPKASSAYAQLRPAL